MSEQENSKQTPEERCCLRIAQVSKKSNMPGRDRITARLLLPLRMVGAVLGQFGGEKSQHVFACLAVLEVRLSQRDRLHGRHNVGVAIRGRETPAITALGEGL